MACIERRPRCGTAEAPIVPEPLTEIAAVVGAIFGAFGVIGPILSGLNVLSVSGGVLSIGPVAVGGAAGAGGISAFLAGFAVLVIVGVYAVERCTEGAGLRECVSGVIEAIVESFDDALDELFPFTATHDRVDVVVRARYWDVVEDGDAFVHCTDEEPPRRSEIMRCYYRDPQVCSAGQGAIVGAGVGVVAGVIAGAAVAAAISCATVILCIFGLIVAALIAAVAALVGALIGGQAARGSAGTSPSADGTTLTVGDYVTVRGNMQRREYDQNANVLWWASSTVLHGPASAGLARPYSYCDVDDELVMDACG